MLFDFVALTQGCENLLVVNYWNATIGVFGSCLGWSWSPHRQA